MRGHAANRYVTDRVTTATPAELVSMLFDAGISSLDAARTAIEEGRRAEAHERLVKAQDIVTELRCSLNLDAGEIAGNLDALYEYTHRLLVEANLHKDIRKIAEARTVLAPLRDAWREACHGVAVAS